MSDCRSLWILCGGCCRPIRRKLRGACRAQYSLAFYQQSLRCVHNIPSGHKAVADPLLTARSARRDVSVYNNVRSAENHRPRAARERNDIARNFFERAVFYIFICSVKAQRRHDRLFGAGVHALFGLRRDDRGLCIFPGSNLVLTLISVILPLAISAVCMAHRKLVCKISNSTESLLEEQRQKLNAEYYAELEHQYDLRDIIIHDIKGHLRTIKQLSQTEKTTA